MTDHAKEIEAIANKFHTYELDRGQYTLHPMTLDGQKLAAAAAELRRLQAENVRLQKTIDDYDTLSNFAKDLAARQRPLPPEFAKVLNENLWELLER